MAYFYLDTSDSQVKLKVNYTITQNKPKNQSTVKVDLYFVNTTRVSSWNEMGGAYYNIGINNNRKGDTNFNFDLRNKSANTQTYIGSHTHTVTHNSSGEAIIPIWVYLRSGISIGTINQTRYITLPRIVNQANIISLSNVNIDEEEIVVNMDNIQSGYRYHLDVMVDGQSYWTRNPTTDQVSLPITETVRNNILSQVTHSNTAVISAVLTTYDTDGNRLGSTSRRTATLTIGDNYAPGVGSHTLAQVNRRNDKLYENISSVKFSLGQNIRGEFNPPSGKHGATIEEIRLANDITGQTIYTLPQSQLNKLKGGETVDLHAYNLSAGDYKFRLYFKDSRGLESSNTWDNTYTVYSYQLPKVVEFNTERDGNNIIVKASIEPGTDEMKYQIILNSTSYVHDSQIVVPLDKYNDGYVKESFNGFFNSSGKYTSVKEDDSFEVELRIYYGTSDYVSARGSVGTADIPLSLGKFGAGVGTLVDDNGAHLQVGEKGLTSGGGGTFYGMVDIDLDDQTKMELKGTSSNGSLMRFIIDGKRSGWIGSWGNDLQVTSPTNDSLVLSSGQITYGGNPLGYSSGDNINGYWIKFNDGTAICYGRLTTTYNQPRVTMVDWYYPIKFNKLPIVIATVSQGSGSGLIATIDDSRTNNLFADVKVTQKEDSVNFTSTKTHDAQVIAIGRWK